MRTLGIIPARGGSKGIPHKNKRLLGGKPLVRYTIDAAQAAQRLSAIALTTDDEELAQIGRACGLEIILRPAELAQDATPMLPVVQHAVGCLERLGRMFDAICLLQPTTPMRRAEHIDGCIELLQGSGADAVVTVLPVPAHHNPHWVYFQGADNTLYLSTGEQTPISRRQDLPPAFHREGSVYVVRRDILMEQHSLYGQRLIGYPLDPDQAVNIDTLADWERAASLLNCQEGS